MDKEVRKVNTKLYLEYLKFKDDMLRKTQEEVFQSCYKIDIQKLFNTKAAYSRSVAEQVKTIVNVSFKFALDKKIFQIIR